MACRRARCRALKPGAVTCCTRASPVHQGHEHRAEDDQTRVRRPVRRALADDVHEGSGPPPQCPPSRERLPPPHRKYERSGALRQARDRHAHRSARPRDGRVRHPALERRGYVAKGEYGIPSRRYFSRPATASELKVHVHAYRRGGPRVVRHLAFRDYLRLIRRWRLTTAR